MEFPFCCISYGKEIIMFICANFNPETDPKGSTQANIQRGQPHLPIGLVLGQDTDGTE